VQWKHAFERITHGVAPVTDGWFVVNAADAQWIHHPDFGWQCPFEANGPFVRQREDIEPVRFPQVGVNISVLARGRTPRVPADTLADP